MGPGLNQRQSGKLARSFRVEARGRGGKFRETKKNIPNFTKALTGSPNSFLIQTGKNKFRSLVDSGAEVSLVHRRVYRSALTKKSAYLQSVNGGHLKIDGCVTLTLKVGGDRNKT